MLSTVGSEATLDLLPLEMWSVDPANSLPLTRKTASQSPGHPSARTSSPQPLQRLRTRIHPHDYSSAWSWDGAGESTRDLPEPKLELRGMAPKCCLTISLSPWPSTCTAQGFCSVKKYTPLIKHGGGPLSFLATDSIWERSLIKSVWRSKGQKHLCWSENLLQSPSRQVVSSDLDTTRVRKVMSPLGWKG